MKKRALLILIIFITLTTTMTAKIYFIRSRSFAEITVDQSYSRFVSQSLKQANGDKKAKLIILEIDTPGGRVDSALKIKDMILSSKLNIYAFVNTHAISAGALIAMACDKIIMAPASVIGDSAPVYQKGGEMKRAGEKTISALRAVFTALAEKNQKPVRVAQAMVDSDIILTKARDGISKKKNKLLTLSTKEALKVKIADLQAENLTDLLKKLKMQAEEIEYLDYSATDQILSFLTNPILTSILLTLGSLGLIFEIKAPGWGIAGTLGLLSLALFFTSQILLNHAPWGAPVLFVIGVILLLIEFFIIPGFGFVGAGGIAIILLSFFLAIGVDNLGYAIRIIASSIVSTIILGAILLKLLPKTKTYSKIATPYRLKGNKSNGTSKRENVKVGDQGIAISNLRPAGTIQLDDITYDAHSEGSFIKLGNEVEVVSKTGFSIIVKGV